jgi:hypothetical protein
MNLDDVAFPIIEEELVPFFGKCGPIINMLNTVLLQNFLKRFDVISPKCDVPLLYRINVLTVFGCNIKVLFSKMYLRAAFCHKLDLRVKA